MLAKNIQNAVSKYLTFHSSIVLSLSLQTHLDERAVGTTVAMGANPLAVAAEKTNSVAKLSFILYITTN